MASSFLSQATSNSKLQLAATAVVSGAVVASAILGYQHLQDQGRKTHHTDESRGGRSIDSSTSYQPADYPTTSPDADKHDDEDNDEDDDNARRIEQLARRARRGDLSEELVLEQLARTRAFLGDDGLARLRAAFVVVVGCGGVGSHAATALARAGVARIRLVDFDQVTLSSLNRHAVATLADVGRPKVHCLRRRLLAVAPWVRFDLRAAKFDVAAAPRLLGPWRGENKNSSGGGDDDDDDDGGDDGDGYGDSCDDDDGKNGHHDGGRGEEGGGSTLLPDFVIDAIDNIDSKVELLQWCHDRRLPVISAMGAGTKSDPTRVAVADIGASNEDALSRATRRRLKLAGVTAGIPVVYSTEKMGDGKAALLPLPEEEFQRGKVGDLGPLPDFRVRILPVLGTLPAVFGYTVANHVILKIAGYPLDYIAGKSRDKLYDAVQAFVQASEEKLVRATSSEPAEAVIGLKVPVTPADIAFLVEELYRGRSVVTGIATRLVLVRWAKPGRSTLVRIAAGAGAGAGAEEQEQRSSDVRLRDLVCMTKEEATRHQNKVLLADTRPEDLYGPDVLRMVAERRDVAAEYEKYIKDTR